MSTEDRPIDAIAVTALIQLRVPPETKQLLLEGARRRGLKQGKALELAVAIAFGGASDVPLLDGGEK